nr:ATP-dependent helicase [Candidatus Omnitrophota bacterium]
MAWDTGLSGKTLDIARYNGPSLCIFAGPGTGKTFSLMRRIARLLEEGADPGEILLVTFTRLAARDLIKKVNELGIVGAERINATTLHSLAFSILIRTNVMSATQRIPRSILKHEQLPLIHDLKKQGLGTITTLRKDVRAFESAWARLQDDEPGWPTNGHDRAVNNHLLSWLKFHKAILIGELVPLTLRYLRNNPVNEYLSKFEHVIVDEYQDLNKAEQELVKILGRSSNITIAGDDDQSIYSFKFAHPEGVIEFSSDVPNTHTEILETCRRCPKKVIILASNLIHNNSIRHEKALLPLDSNPDGEVMILQWRGIRKEANGIARLVKYYTEDVGIPLGQVLILVQRKELAKYIEEELASLHMSYSSYYSDSSLEDPALRSKYALLCLLADSNDLVALRNWLAVDSSTLNVTEYSKLMAYCQREGRSPKEALEGLVNQTITIAGTEKIKNSYNLLNTEIARLSGLSAEDVVNDLFPEGEEILSSLRKLALSIIASGITTEELAKSVREQLIQPEIEEERLDISIMSLHKAKGLEAELVIIANCVEGLLPYIDNYVGSVEQQKQLEESRRLFYVGMTRTKRYLILSNCTYMKKGDAMAMRVGYSGSGSNVALQTSRFISEDLGPEKPDVELGEDKLAELEI